MWAGPATVAPSNGKPTVAREYLSSVPSSLMFRGIYPGANSHDGVQVGLLVNLDTGRLTLRRAQANHDDVIADMGTVDFAKLTFLKSLVRSGDPKGAYEALLEVGSRNLTTRIADQHVRELADTRARNVADVARSTL